MSARLFDFDGHRDSPTANWLRWNEFIGHLTMVLLKVDRASMFHSIEVRVPLLDREVIDVATAVDWSSCLDLESGLGKLPLRASLARHTNRQTLEKRGFQVPMGEWMRTSLRPVFEDTVLSRSELAGAPIARASLRQMYDVHLSGAQDLASGLWVLLSLAMWEDHHLLARGRSERGPERPSLTVSARTPTTGREPGPVPESLSGGRGR
jgi:asparagine synthase (glutamine-hydrolysing)